MRKLAVRQGVLGTESLARDGRWVDFRPAKITAILRSRLRIQLYGMMEREIVADNLVETLKGSQGSQVRQVWKFQIRIPLEGWHVLQHEQLVASEKAIEQPSEITPIKLSWVSKQLQVATRRLSAMDPERLVELARPNNRIWGLLMRHDPYTGESLGHHGSRILQARAISRLTGLSPDQALAWSYGYDPGYRQELLKIRKQLRAKRKRWVYRAHGKV